MLIDKPPLPGGGPIIVIPPILLQNADNAQDAFEKYAEAMAAVERVEAVDDRYDTRAWRKVLDNQSIIIGTWQRDINVAKSAALAAVNGLEQVLKGTITTAKATSTLNDAKTKANRLKSPDKKYNMTVINTTLATQQKVSMHWFNTKNSLHK
ncbi:hypothetical protein MKY34_21770 [Sporosarcina sp. FSL K6-1522]|uniref:hypothetical protein n=1 Tax=Sporosarcina sp. FSL K6-1522 TaxID=2921554 RepID=UPI003159E938